MRTQTSLFASPAALPLVPMGQQRVGVLVQPSNEDTEGFDVKRERKPFGPAWIDLIIKMSDDVERVFGTIVTNDPFGTNQYTLRLTLLPHQNANEVGELKRAVLVKNKNSKKAVQADETLQQQLNAIVEEIKAQSEGQAIVVDFNDNRSVKAAVRSLKALQRIYFPRELGWVDKLKMQGLQLIKNAAVRLPSGR